MSYWRNSINATSPQQEVFELAISHLKRGDAASASNVCIEGLKQFPEDASILCLAGQSLIALHRLEDARIHIEKARSLHPDFAMSHEMLADLLLVEGQPEAAIESYQHSLQLTPNREQLTKKIDHARALASSSGRDSSGKRKTMAFPDEMAKAAQFSRDGDQQKSEAIYRDILRRDPEHIEAMRLFAEIASSLQKYRDAEILLKRATSLAPDYARVWRDLSKVQTEQKKFDEAITHAKQVVELLPKLAEPLITLANVQALAGDPDLAMDNYREALAISPEHTGALAGLAHQLKTMGRQKEAVSVYRQSIAANPRNADAYWNLANLKTFRFEESEVQAMEELLKDDTLEDLAVAQVNNALGFEYEGRKDYTRAFSHFQRCNNSKRKTESYDPVANQVTTEAIIEVFNEDYLQKNRGNGNNDPSPILIVGLPRSGSTLIEQILASHSQVEGTHELAELDRAVSSLPKLDSKRARFPETLLPLKEKIWTKIGSHYLEKTQKYRSGTPRFIDKNPNNFIYVGLLQLALPNAKIINARRHPMDSCFGSYKQLFASGQPFSYDLTDLGEYYTQYQTLMDHWQKVLPGKVLDVNYEEVVGDLESQVRRILDYCELPFEEECVKFHETSRAIKTASSEQVRQPIYSSSVNLWQHYESDLEELIEVLEPLIVEKS